MNSWYLPWFLSFAAVLVVSGLPTPENLVRDVDGGIDRDIFDINEDLGLDLFEGDIRFDGIYLNLSHLTNVGIYFHLISGANDHQLQWPCPWQQATMTLLDQNPDIRQRMSNQRSITTDPFMITEMNAKGEILNAFERYRLKTCIDFKPWAGETNYISVFKGSGCWSSVGNRHVGRQELSIGANCDRIATIQHEFLHALGFWHEQSRSDRDDYVSIIWERIQSGKEHNFNTYNDQQSDSLNVPYDYTSVMHYSKTAFQNGTEPTIVTRISDFMNVIGQRMDFSDYDLLKLNRLYNCYNGNYFWDSPSKVGEVAFFPNGTQFRRGMGFGTSAFITHERLKSRDFIKGNDVYILLTVEDISHLNSTQTEPIPPGSKDLCTSITCENDGVCTAHSGKAECSLLRYFMMNESFIDAIHLTLDVAVMPYRSENLSPKLVAIRTMMAFIVRQNVKWYQLLKIQLKMQPLTSRNPVLKETDMHCYVLLYVSTEE
ncbi:meprin A subunit beta [Orycteropus afer afer]|uniref:Metalloendopeptidase n=1 Tax=Orycteropus afer afer TaxID=1230840 RepID=A0A8B7A7C3_ORYAF|nr:meprin A subunit beta [Orycteropus afer afer]